MYYKSKKLFHTLLYHTCTLNILIVLQGVKFATSFGVSTLWCITPHRWVSVDLQFKRSNYLKFMDISTLEDAITTFSWNIRTHLLSDAASYLWSMAASAALHHSLNSCNFIYPSVSHVFNTLKFSKQVGLCLQGYIVLLGPVASIFNVSPPWQWR